MDVTKLLTKQCVDDSQRDLLTELMLLDAKKYMQSISDLDYVIQYMLHHQVKPRIKGEITLGKIRWRGISLAYGPGNNFIGLLQRGKLIWPDWTIISLSYQAQKSFMFGTSRIHEKREKDKLYMAGGLWEQIK